MNKFYHLGDKLIIQCGEMNKVILDEFWKLGSKYLNGLSAVLLSLVVDKNYYIRQRNRLKHMKKKRNSKNIKIKRPFQCTTNFSLTPQENYELLYTKNHSISVNENREKTSQQKSNYRKILFYIITFPYILLYIVVGILQSIIQLLFPLPFQLYDNENHGSKITYQLSTRSTGLFEDIHYSIHFMISTITYYCRYYWAVLFSIDPPKCNITSTSKSTSGVVNPIHLPTESEGTNTFIFGTDSLKKLTFPDDISNNDINIPLSCPEHSTEEFTALQNYEKPPDQRDHIQYKLLSSVSITRGIYGYPIESHTLTTPDGYILTLLRIPNYHSDRCIYFQAGLLDTSYAWISTDNATSIAIRMYELGYDVYMGNFRGTTGHYKDHQNKVHAKYTVQDKEYWEFNLDDLTIDIYSVIHKIKEIKKDKEIKIGLLAHSMGGCVAILYLLHCIFKNRPSYLDKVICMAPAGVHSSLDTFRSIMFSVVKKFMYMLPSGYPWPLRNSNVHNICAQMLQDMMTTPSTLDLLNNLCTFIIGGNANECPFQRINYTDYPLGVTSSTIMKHGCQCVSRNKFESYDYGSNGNILRFGSPDSINYLEYYKYIYTPIFFMSGQKDPLIPPNDVFKQYELIQENCKSTKYKSYENAGHLAFTFIQNDEITSDIIHFFSDFNKVDFVPSGDIFPKFGYTKVDSDFKGHGEHIRNGISLRDIRKLVSDFF